MSNRFTLTTEHVRLLRALNWQWDDTEFGGPAVDPKRPFGNSTGIHEDIAQIIAPEFAELPPNEVESWLDETTGWLESAYRETQMALAVVLSAGQITPGVYERGSSGPWSLAAATDGAPKVPHDAFTAAARLAPLPTDRYTATTADWIRYYAAQALAAFSTFHTEVAELTPSTEPGSRPDIGYLAVLGHTSVAAAVALETPTAFAATLLWDLTPEQGALNGEWEEWVADALERHGVNPAAIDPRYRAGDFTAPMPITTSNEEN